MGNEFSDLRRHWSKSHEAERDQRASWRVPRMAQIDALIAAMKDQGWHHTRASMHPKAGERVLCWDPGADPFVGYEDKDDYRRWWAEVDGDLWPIHPPLMWKRSDEAQIKIRRPAPAKKGKA